MMPVQYPYPESSWATGKMRKRGEPVAMKQGPVPTFEMDRAAGAGLAARGGPTGTTDVPGAIMGQPLKEMFSQHKEQIQDAVNGVATGDVTPGWLKKMLQKFGWTQSSEPGKFRDPEGGDHMITATKPEQEAPGPGPAAGAR